MAGWYKKFSGVSLSEATLLSCLVKRTAKSHVFSFLSVTFNLDNVYGLTYLVFVQGTIGLLVSNRFFDLVWLSCLQFQFHSVFTASKFVLAETSAYVSVSWLLYWQPPLKTMETSIQRILCLVAILFCLGLWV